MYERITQVRKNFNLTQDAFASKIGLSRSAISNIENGNRTITNRVISDICREFNVNEEWLRTGIGDMLIEPDTFSLDEYAKQRGCTDLQIELVKSLLDLDIDTLCKLMKAFKPAYDKLVGTEDEISATIEATSSKKLSISEEVENYRKELEAAQKGITPSILEIGKEKIS